MDKPTIDNRKEAVQYAPTSDKCRGHSPVPCEECHRHMDDCDGRDQDEEDEEEKAPSPEDYAPEYDPAWEWEKQNA